MDELPVTETENTNTIINPTNSTYISQEQLQLLQEQALAELEGILASCDNVDAVMEEVSIWQDKYNIIDIDSFFIDDTLRIKARNLISQKFEEFKRKQEEAKATLCQVSQKRTFFRLYNICLSAKNDKDFESSKEKLKDWLKDHPENTWNQFNENYQKFFNKFANEDYLKYATGYSKQEEIISSLENIVDYSVRYSNFAFFEESMNKWQENYANRDEFLNLENKEKVQAMINEGYEKLTPPEMPEVELNEFSNFNRRYSLSVTKFCNSQF